MTRYQLHWKSGNVENFATLEALDIRYNAILMRGHAWAIVRISNAHANPQEEMTTMARKQIEPQHHARENLSIVVDAVLRDFYGNRTKAIEYCESVAKTNGPLSPIYADAAKRIREEQ